MKVFARRFNLYLALAVLLGLACGCQTAKPKLTGALRLHVESAPDPAGTTSTITLLRSTPVVLTVKREPILTEANLLSARVIDAAGGFALEFKFDETGTWLLEQYTASNVGNHFAIWAQWNENGQSPFAAADILDLTAFAAQLNQATNPVSTLLMSRLSPSTQDLLARYRANPVEPGPLKVALATDLNRIIAGPSIYDARAFQGVKLRKETKSLLEDNPRGPDLLRLNRLLIEDAYPKDLLRDRRKALDSRWLAAPLISRRVDNGILTFTPDCDRNDADQIVLGLNATAKALHKSMVK